MSSPYGPQSYPPGYGPGWYPPTGAPGHPPGAAPPGAYGAYGPPPPPPAPAAPVFPPPAGYGARAVAYMIDSFLSGALWTVLFYGGTFLLIRLVDPDGSDAREAVTVIGALALLALACFAGFCYFWIPHARSGRTPGKYATGVKVISMKTGEPPSLGPSAGRQLVAFLMSAVTCVGPLLDLLWPLWDEPYRQAVHDKAVGTRVITVRGADAYPYTPQPYPGSAAAPDAPPPPGGGWY